MHYALHIIQVLTQRFHFTSEPNLNWKMARTSGSETVLVITSRLPRHMHSWKLLQLSRKTFAAVVFFSENQVWDLFSTQSIQHHRTKTCHSLANDQSHIFSFYLFFIIVEYLSLSACVFPWKRKIVWGNTSVEQTNSLVALSTRWTHIGKRFSLLQRWKDQFVMQKQKQIHASSIEVDLCFQIRRKIGYTDCVGHNISTICQKS